MSNVLFGKLGQEIVYDRMLPEAIRSNTNGNYEAYNMLRMLLDTDNNIFCVHDNIKISFEQQKELWNMYLITDFAPQIDVAFILLGVNEFHVSQTLLDLINSGIKWYALCSDPRCLHKLAHLIKNPPDEVYAGAEGEKVEFAGITFTTKYLNIEAANVYDEELLEVDINTKHDKMVIISNHTDDWDRLGDIKQLTMDIPANKVVVYGRLGKDAKPDDMFKGERDIQFVYNAQLMSRMSLIAPIYPGWITAKYLECIVRGVIPMMTCNYGMSVECFSNDISRIDPNMYVSNASDVRKAYDFALDDENYLETIYMLNREVYNKYGPAALQANLNRLIKGETL